MKHIKSFNASNTQITNVIEEWLHNDLHKEVLKMRFCRGLTFEQIAYDLDLSPATVKKIVYCYENVLNNHLCA